MRKKWYQYFVCPICTGLLYHEEVATIKSESLIDFDTGYIAHMTSTKESGGEIIRCHTCKIIWTLDELGYERHGGRLIKTRTPHEDPPPF